jgi:hypothetical protein
MIRLLVAAQMLIGILLAPAALGAQVHGQMAAGREFGQNGDDPLLSEPRPVNEVSVLIQHRQQLALTDTQFVQLVSIRRAVDSLNFPLERRLDSLIRVERGASSAFRRLPADTVRHPRDLARGTLDAMASNIRPATERAHTLLSDHQVELAATYEQQARDMAEQQARDAARTHGGIRNLGRPPD